MAQVFDLTRGCYIHYTLSPKEAVLAAHQQYDRKNFNTWTYGYSAHAPIHYKTIKRHVGKDSDNIEEITLVSCGNFSCLCRHDEVNKVIPQDYELGE